VVVGVELEQVVRAQARCHSLVTALMPRRLKRVMCWRVQSCPNTGSTVRPRWR
jgi:hypothetical protein